MVVHDGAGLPVERDHHTARLVIEFHRAVQRAERHPTRTNRAVANAAGARLRRHLNVSRGGGH